MGRLFLVVYVLLFADILSADQILLPKSPVRGRQLSDDEIKLRHQNNIERKRKRRNRRSHVARKPNSEMMRDELLKLSRRDTPLDFGFNIGVGMIGLAQVSGEREGYHLDPPVFFRGFWRIDEKSSQSEWNQWLGFRWASFSGTGAYKNVAGRFGLSYFGPMYAIGKYDPVTESTDDNTTVPLVRHGHVWAFGISYASGFGETGESVSLSDEEFGRQSYFDSPGIWGEYQYSWLHYGGIDLSVQAGIQFGKQKTIFYLGSNIGGWI